MKKSTRYSTGRLTAEMQDARYENGSALILVVVLTSLLAIVGVMFVMVARVDKIATSGISENKTLDSAVEVVIARISQELVLDVPGMPKGRKDYYDYPDANNAWLASLEPYKDGGYKWRQISDVYNKLGLSLELDAEIIPDYQDDVNEGLQADADGDGVADSKWIELEGINSSKGKTIYAAIRVIDNGAMLNVNTAYKFDPNETDKDLIDGSSQMQINLMALSWRPGTTSYNPLDETDLLQARANNGSGGLDPLDLDEYEKNVVWRYNEPDGPYTPFDISDDLELRYRFLVNQQDIDTRLEELGAAQGRSWEFRTIYAFRTPAETGDLGEWFISSYDDGSLDPNYAYRHIGTTHNMDRIINPYGGKMVNVNRDGAGFIYNAIRQGIDVDPTFYDVNEIAAQIAVNLIDYRDSDPNVTPFDFDEDGIYDVYGFERPCVYISELVHKFKKLIPPGGPIGPGGEVEPVIYRSYAIELYKPYTGDKEPIKNDWKLVIGETPGGPIGAPVFGAKEYYIDWSDTKDFHVILFEDPEAKLNVDPAFVQEPDFDRYSEIFEGGDLIELQRRVRANDGSYIWVTVDSSLVPNVNAAWLNPDASPISRSVQRDITLHKCIRRLWSAPLSGSTLGVDNSYTDPDPNTIQAHPENEDFTNVGEIGMVFRKGAYYRDRGNRDDRIGYGTNKTEEQVRLDLADPNFQQIFQYLTRFDPTSDGIDNDGDGYGEAEIDPDELKIPGRININTAPWYVIAQLPWVSDKLAQAIVAYRDKAVIPDQNSIDYANRGVATDIDGIREEAGFASIAELATVVNDSGEDEYSMRYYALDSNDLEDFPDLTTPDHPLGGAEDDFEERDVIFARISNLVTVRSDVFTAYILVRIGADGPQKRVMAILDRSNVYTGDGRVQIVALHAVADPR